MTFPIATKAIHSYRTAKQAILRRYQPEAKESANNFGLIVNLLKLDDLTPEQAYDAVITYHNGLLECTASRRMMNSVFHHIVDHRLRPFLLLKLRTSTIDELLVVAQTAAAQLAEEKHINAIHTHKYHTRGPNGRPAER